MVIFVEERKLVLADEADSEICQFIHQFKSSTYSNAVMKNIVHCLPLSPSD
jgi:hypothetical protein